MVSIICIYNTQTTYSLPNVLFSECLMNIQQRTIIPTTVKVTACKEEYWRGDGHKNKMKKVKTRKRKEKYCSWMQ